MVRASVGGSVAVGGLREGANYSLSVRARASAGAGPAAAPVYCSTAEDGEYIMNVLVDL